MRSSSVTGVREADHSLTSLQEQVRVSSANLADVHSLDCWSIPNLRSSSSSEPNHWSMATSAIEPKSCRISQASRYLVDIGDHWFPDDGRAHAFSMPRADPSGHDRGRVDHGYLAVKAESGDLRDRSRRCSQSVSNRVVRGIGYEEIVLLKLPRSTPASPPTSGFPGASPPSADQHAHQRESTHRTVR